MKKILLILSFAVTLSTPLLSQNLANLSERERNNQIYTSAKEALMKHGPDFFRDHQPPLIEKKIVSWDKKELTSDEKENNLGKIYYTVTYPCNDRDRRNRFEYPAKVFIWNDSGKVFSIMFGHGWGYAGLDSDINTRGADEPPMLMPYVDHDNTPKDTVNLIIMEERTE